ncbi:MAG: carboxypeptidase-like regulatory domain-containing protein [Ignavibacteria bacterium]|nr:carboxypeptidase-like regulatory domain-containing protein [Ignavibacteria bacterium]
MNTLLAVAILMSVLISDTLYAQTVITGIVVDSTTDQPIGGASIRIVGTTRGTYTKSNGEYRLPLTQGATTISVRSIGYRETTVAIGNRSSIRIALIASGVLKGQVTVTADITPEEVVRRAIERKEENSKRIKTLVSTLYSKMNVGIVGEGLMSKGVSNAMIAETFSRVYDQRLPTKKKRVHILQRRQTKNILPKQNLAVFDQFFDFMDDEITILETRLVTPLSKEALDEYQFRIIDKKPLGDQMVYQIAFEPRSRIYPGFEGNLTIIEGTYQAIAAEFAPTDETAFPFLKGLKFAQRFEKLNDTLWVPMYAHSSALVKFQVFVGLFEMSADVSVETYVTDVEANIEIPDSLLQPPIDTSKQSEVKVTSRSASVSVRQNNKIVTVENDADSIRPEFWDAHAFAELSEKEREEYRKVDSMVLADTNKKDTSRRSTIHLVTIGDVGVDFYPVLDRSHITGMMYGGGISTSWQSFRLSTGFALGQKGTRVGSVGFNIGIIRDSSLTLQGNIDVYSRLKTLQPSPLFLGRADNSAHLFYADYFDFYRQDGWSVGFSMQSGAFKASIAAASSRHINMPVITGLQRTTLIADQGSYRTLEASVSGGETSLAEEFAGGKSVIDGTMKLIYGMREEDSQTFGTIELSGNVRIPTFATGYRSMYLDVHAEGGTAINDYTPNQYLFTLMRRFPVLGRLTDLSSVEINSYRGSQYVLLHSEHNFSDLWWRALRIPTFPNKRGLDLIGVFGLGVTKVSGQTRMATEGWSETKAPFMEAGFALARIPTFVSDLFYLRFDAMWPLGRPAVQTGRFGWTITLSTPLL